MEFQSGNYVGTQLDNNSEHPCGIDQNLTSRKSEILVQWNKGQ